MGSNYDNNGSTVAIAGSRVGINTTALEIEASLEAEEDQFELQSRRGFNSRVKQDFSYKNPGWVSVRSLATTSTLGSEKVAEDLADFAKKDKKDEKTWSRRVAETLMDYKWYFPHKDDPERKKRLNEGWAYFEHITLARHFPLAGSNGDSSSRPEFEAMKRAEPGEKRSKTTLYSYFKTNGEPLADWGIGVALYFNTMLVMAGGLVLAGLVSLFNTFFFLSEEYNGTGQDELDPFTIRGSAVCTDFSWVACEPGYCDLGQLDAYGVEYQIADGNVFVKKSLCDGAQMRAGLTNYVSILLLLIVTLLFNVYQSKRQVIFDEDKLTASDYSVMVRNPPPDATDPDKWHEFFSQYDEKGVNLVTILLDNTQLLRLLIRRRHLKKELLRWIPDNPSIDKVDNDIDEEVKKIVSSQSYEPKGPVRKFLYLVIRPFVKPFNMFLFPQEIYDRLEENKKMIEEDYLQEDKKYEAKHVIVTFETEEGQRIALKTLNAGMLDIKFNRRGDRLETNLFEGKVLDVVEPPEPSAVRYLDLDASALSSLIMQAVTFSVTIGLVIVGGIIVHSTRKSSGAFWAGILTTVLNTLIPTVVKLLMLIEKHPSEGERQKSMYLKITIFRWVNTAVTVKFATPFMNTLQNAKDDLIPAINGIFVSEIFIVPILSLLDIMGNLSKHYFAPRAKTSEQLLLCFKGTQYNLAEKYTDISKILFLAYYYSALNPTFLFMGAFAILIRYFTNKFCLLRIWSAAPYIGTGLADFSRKYFFSFAIVAGAVVSAYDWALFRFDRVCEGQSGSFTPGKYVNDTLGTSVTIESTDSVRVCNEDTCCQKIGLSWPPVPNNIETDQFKWMSDEQRNLAQIYGWTSFVFVISYLVLAFGPNIFVFVKSLFSGTYQPIGQDQHVDFSSVPDIDGYIPQIKVGSYAYPLIAADIDYIDQSLIGWNDPGRAYDESNMGFDINFGDRKGKREKIVGSTRHNKKIKDHKDFKELLVDDDTKLIFSIVKQWAPRRRGLVC